jgi:hypothetical protein
MPHLRALALKAFVPRDKRLGYGLGAVQINAGRFNSRVSMNFRSKHFWSKIPGKLWWAIPAMARNNGFSGRCGPGGTK